jgi:hypothetical protein
MAQKVAFQQTRLLFFFFFSTQKLSFSCVGKNTVHDLPRRARDKHQKRETERNKTIFRKASMAIAAGAALLPAASGVAPGSSSGGGGGGGGAAVAGADSAGGRAARIAVRENARLFCALPCAALS